MVTDITCWWGLAPLAHAPQTAQEWAVVVAYHLLVVGFLGEKIPHTLTRRVGIAAWAAGAMAFVAIVGHALLTRA